jgi:hypothetical protein
MQRKKMLIVVLAIALLIGTVSAAVLTYYGQITGTVTITQAVLLDGKAWPDSSITETVSGVAGSQLYGDLHRLVNHAEKVVIVNLPSTVTSAPYGDAAGLTVQPCYRLESTIGSADNDEDAVPFTNDPITWGDFGSITFDYYIESGSTDTKAPHVNIYMENINCLVSTHGKEPTGTIGSWNIVTYRKADFSAVSGTISDIGSFGLKYGFTIESGSPGVINTVAQVVWVKNIVALKSNGNGIALTGIRLPTQTYPNIPARVMEFKMSYDFRFDACPGTYVVRTDVVPIGYGEVGHYP